MRRLAFLVVLILAGAASASNVLAATVNVHAGSYYFEDGTVGDGKITAQVGDQIRVYVDDGGGRSGKPHSVNVDELGIHSGSLAKGSVYVTPPLLTAGSFRFYCKFHKAAPNNHWTTLIVSGATATPKPTPAPTSKPTPAPTLAPGVTATPKPTLAPGATPTATPGATPTATPGATLATGASATPPGASGEASAAPQASDGAIAVLPDGGDDPAPSSGMDEDLLPSGVTTPGDLPWLRSVWVGLAALIPLAALALAAIGMARRRR